MKKEVTILDKLAYQLRLIAQEEFQTSKKAMLKAKAAMKAAKALIRG